MKTVAECECIQGKDQAVVLAGWIAGLTGLSLFVIVLGAAQEPYTHFNATDALVQVGLGMCLLALWAERLTSATVSVLRGRLSKWGLMVIGWGVIVWCYLAISPFGYVEDLTRFGAR